MGLVFLWLFGFSRYPTPACLFWTVICRSLQASLGLRFLTFWGNGRFSSVSSIPRSFT